MTLAAPLAPAHAQFASAPGGEPPICAGAPADAPANDAMGPNVMHKPIAAETSGHRVVLNPDGTWRLPKPSGTWEMDAITETGHSIVLVETLRPEGCVERTWKVAPAGGGVIQIVVSRTITTAQSLHSQDDNCIPVIAARNLNAHGLQSVIAEIEFVATDGERATTSLLFGPLDHGEERERTSSPLFLAGCKGVTGSVRAVECRLDNGARCESIVRASDRGIIPLTMEAPEIEHVKTGAKEDR